MYPESPYGLNLKKEKDNLLGSDDKFHFYENLSGQNSPMYFWEFMERAEKFNMQYLGDAVFKSMMVNNFSKKAQEKLQKIGRSILDLEQYMDFLRNRKFRQCLLCHKSIKLDRQVDHATAPSFHITSELSPTVQNIDPASQSIVDFKSSKELSLTTGEPIFKAALKILSEMWPLSISFDALLKGVRKLLVSDEDTLVRTLDGKDDHFVLGKLIISCYSSKLMELSVGVPSFVLGISKKPSVSALVMEMAKLGKDITGRRHNKVKINNFERIVLQHLNGKNIHESIVDLTLGDINGGSHGIVVNEILNVSEKRRRESVEKKLKDSLNYFSKNCLLIK